MRRRELKILLLPGDGVGPEVVGEARRLLETIDAYLSDREGTGLRLEEALVGGAAIDATEAPLPIETLRLARESDAVLLGAVGGPKWDNLGGHQRPEAGLLGLRKWLGLFANLRPVLLRPGLEAVCPIRADIAARGVDLIIFRELTGGLYFGPRERQAIGPGEEKAYDTMVYTSAEVRRIARMAFRAARQRRRKVTSVDKANVLESSRLWRQVVADVAQDFPDVELEHQLVDSAAMRLVFRPSDYDVILTENMFGDILSDLAAALAGSMGLLPSASLGESGPGLYEPVHGSAPDIAGQGVANPLATLLSVALMFRFSLGRPAVADAVDAAVARALAAGYRTRDIWTEGTTLVGTRDMGEAVRRELEAILARGGAEGGAGETTQGAAQEAAEA